jgi:protein TonB
MAVHLAAVGGLLLAGNRVAGTPPEPPRTPIVLATVRANTDPPPKGQPSVNPPKQVTQRRVIQEPPPAVLATPEPFVAPPTISDLTLDDNLEPAAGDPTAVYCPECPPTGAVGVSGVPDGEPGGTGGEPVRVSVIEAPRKLHHVQPTYPRVGVVGRIEGDVRIDCVIGTDGLVRDARVLSGPVFLREAALEAVRQWVYSPPRMNGHSVSVLLTVTVRFRIPG